MQNMRSLYDEDQLQTWLSPAGLRKRFVILLEPWKSRRHIWPHYKCAESCSELVGTHFSLCQKRNISCYSFLSIKKKGILYRCVFTTRRFRVKLLPLILIDVYNALANFKVNEALGFKISRRAGWVDASRSVSGTPSCLAASCIAPRPAPDADTRRKFKP